MVKCKAVIRAITQMNDAELAQFRALRRATISALEGRGSTGEASRATVEQDPAALKCIECARG